MSSLCSFSNACLNSSSAGSVSELTGAAPGRCSISVSAHTIRARSQPFLDREPGQCAGKFMVEAQSSHTALARAVEPSSEDPSMFAAVASPQKTCWSSPDVMFDC